MKKSVIKGFSRSIFFLAAIFILMGAAQAGATSYVMTFSGTVELVSGTLTTIEEDILFSGLATLETGDTLSDGSEVVTGGSLTLTIGDNTYEYSLANNASGYLLYPSGDYTYDEGDTGYYLDNDGLIFVSDSDGSDLIQLFLNNSYDKIYINMNDPVSSNFIVGAVTDISLNPVPEPATMLLLGSGLVGVAGLRRRFKKVN